MGETNEDVYIFHGMINNERFQIITGQNKWITINKLSRLIL